MIKMNGVTYSEMVSKLAKSGKALMESMSEDKLHVWHMSSCIMGEVGELVEGYRQRDSANIKEEIGDIEFYMAGLRDGVGLSYDEVMEFETDGRDRFNNVDNPLDGLVVHSAKLFDACKKWIIYAKELDRQAVIHQMNIFEFYMCHVRMRAGLTREECLLANMEKLARRYGPGYGYTDEKAQNRADKVLPARKFLGQLDQ